MMKVLHKKIGLLTTFCYCVGILFIAYLLISLPQDLKNLTLGLPINVLDQLEPMFNKLNISIAVVLTLGMTSLLLLLFNDKNNSSVQQFHVSESSNIKSATNNKEQQEEEDKVESDVIFLNADKIIKDNADLLQTSGKILSLICKEFEASQAAIYRTISENDQKFVALISSFAYPVADEVEIKFEFGEGLVGQAAKESKIINIDSVPNGYINILSGLGSSSPTNLIILPIISEGIVRGIAEIASFKKFSKKDEDIIAQVLAKLAIIFQGDSEQTSLKKTASTVQ